MEIQLSTSTATSPHSAQIVVVGMHRSGTSVTTSVLNGLGAFVGEAASLTVPNQENPKGFFERRDARRICDALLHGAGADWWKIAGFSLDAISAESQETQKAAIQALVASLDEHGTWALKEPRLSLLLPLFLPYLSRPFVVFVYRNPTEVAQSLRKRNGFPTTFGLALWEAYNVHALRNTAGLPSVFLDYADLLVDPNASGARIVDAIAAHGGQGVIQKDVGVLVDTALYRERSDGGEQHELLTETQLTLWRELKTGHPAAGPRSVSPRARIILKEYEADEAARAEATRKQIQQGTRKLQTELDALRSKHAKKEAELAEAATQVRALQAAQSRADIDLLELRERLKLHIAREESARSAQGDVIAQEVKAVRADVDRIRSAQDTILQRLAPHEPDAAN